MPNKDFASRKATRSLDGDQRLVIEMVRRGQGQACDDAPLAIVLKKGATEDQADALCESLNQLGVSLLWP